MRDYLLAAYHQAREAAAVFFAMLFVVSVILGAAVLFQSCANGRPPIEQLRGGDR